MKLINPALFTLYILQLIPGGLTGPPQQRSIIQYGAKIVPTKMIEHPGYDLAENIPHEMDHSHGPSALSTTSSSFYDPTYGFSQESIAAILSQDNKESKAEPVLSAVLLNSKDYYKLFNNYNNPKIHDKDKATYVGKAGYHFLQPEDLKFSENKNNYASVVSHDAPYNKPETPEFNQLFNRVNSEQYNKGDKPLDSTEGEQFYRNLMDERYKYGTKPKAFVQQRPQHVVEERRPQFVLEERRPQFVVDERFRTQPVVVEDSAVQKRPPQYPNDVIVERNRNLDELLEESKALTEQIKRLRIRTERELNSGAQLQRKGRGFSHRYFRQ